MATDTSAPEVAHKPYVPDERSIPEFTWPAVISGTLLGIVFGASSLYLVLRVGMTVSASIPVAVLSITLFRGLSRAFGMRPATILENNITQTAGSAGESIAFGVGVTMPALMLLGFDMDVTRIMVVSVLGGLLGILMMIPLRRAFIVRMHGKPGEPGTLLYPEGTACAQVLISGEQGGTSGKTVFVGFGLAFAVKFIIEGMTLLELTLKWPLKFFNRVATITSDMAPELLGVGYVIGLRISAIMMAGAVIGNLVIVPAIATFGDAAPAIIPPGDKPIAKMELGDIQKNYLRFIGAGCVTAAGIISMARTLPLIVRTMVAGMGKLRGAGGRGVRRTERDLPMTVVLFGSLALLAALAVFLYRDLTAAGDAGALFKAVLGAALVLLFGFLFVMVSSRLTGEVGSSSNPISGMTVATLSLTCLIFLTLGMTSPAESVLALSVAAVVCIAASNGGTTSQDLKTGFLVGGTPRLQQYAILIGALTSALVIGGTLLLFNQAGTVVSTKNAPDVTLPPSKLAQLAERVTYDGHDYRVWRARTGEAAGVEAGKYYVDDAGKVVAVEDPAITGRVKVRDDGSEVKMKFDAPKTQVMGIIINGVLSRQLDWGLVLIGAMLAVGLELCGVSSLAFAVGVYIPMQYTTPIFLGGILRYVVDAYMSKPAAAAVPGQARDATGPPTSEAEAEVAAIAETETSPGVLLSSGYIAGGSLAGVLIAFLEFPFFKPIKDAVNYSRPVEGGGEAPYVAGDLWPALVFSGLMVFLVLVGIGLLLKAPTGAGPTRGIEEEGMR